MLLEILQFNIAKRDAVSSTLLIRDLAIATDCISYLASKGIQMLDFEIVRLAIARRREYVFYNDAMKCCYSDGEEISNAEQIAILKKLF